MATQIENNHSSKLPFLQLYKSSLLEVIRHFKIYACLTLPVALLLLSYTFLLQIEAEPTVSFFLYSGVLAGLGVSIFTAPVFHFTMTNQIGEVYKNLTLCLKIFITSLIFFSIAFALYMLLIGRLALVTALPIPYVNSINIHLAALVIIALLASNFSPYINVFPASAVGKKMSIKEILKLGNSNRLRLVASLLLCCIIFNSILLALLSFPVLFLFNITSAFLNIDMRFATQFVQSLLQALSVVLMCIYYANIHKSLTSA